MSYFKKKKKTQFTAYALAVIIWQVTFIQSDAEFAVTLEILSSTIRLL